MMVSCGLCVIQRACVESVLWGRRQYDGFMWPVCVIQRTCVESVLWGRKQYDGFMWPVCDPKDMC